MRPPGRPAPPAPEVTVVGERPGDEPAPPRSRAPVAPTRRDLAIGAGAVVLAIVVTAVLAFRAGGSGASPAAGPSAVAKPSASGPPTTAQIYAAAAPSVVSIEAAEAGGVATGTGVIVGADGSIFTALHVVKGASAIKVRFADGTESAAEMTDSDPAS